MENQVAKKQESPLARLTNELNSKDWASYIEKNVTNDRKAFTSTLIALASQNDLLARCTTKSIVFSAMKAVILDLPLDSSFGYAYVIPYKDTAQFQIGYRGFVQLAERTKEFERIECDAVYKGENLPRWRNRVSGDIEFDKLDEIKKNEIVGYMAWFKLKDSIEKFCYMSISELKIHAQTYSQMAKFGKGLWADESTFGAMAKKTCLKKLLKDYAPISIGGVANESMRKAVDYDQRVFDTEDEKGRYADNPQNQSLLDDDTEDAEVVEEKPQAQPKQEPKKVEQPQKADPSEEEIQRKIAFDDVKNAVSIGGLSDIVKQNITLFQTDKEFLELVNQKRNELSAKGKENKLDL